ncbi:MAG: Nif11-like leader peptide family natural product precursor [Actinobacteria bacterium]|nr:Nif11-like leader peptide family natural product precursor [Actinomycetota bacterium]
MSQQQAEAFIARVQEDPEFAERLSALKDDPAAAQALVVAEGFDATPEEIREAFLEAFGAELSEEQLAAITGGDDVAMALVGVNAGILFVATAAVAV